MKNRKRNFHLNLKNKPTQKTDQEKKCDEYRNMIKAKDHNPLYDSLFEKVFKKTHMKKIGQGSQGIVYKLISDDLKKYAVKETDVSMSPLKELYLMKQIKHPKIVSLFDYRVHKDNLYMLLEYMNGGTLKEMIYYSKTIKEDYLKLFTFQILEGLHFIHAKMKIFHRDLKPANLLFNLDGCLKLADFGVSAQVVKTLDQKSTYVGTEKYMAPERLNGPKHGSKSDIYSLGIMIYECYYGHHPVNYENQLDFIEKMKSFKMPSDADPVFADFINCCLKYEPLERSTSSQLLDHEWLRLARKINEDNKLELFCKKFLVDQFKKKKQMIERDD